MFNNYLTQVFLKINQSSGSQSVVCYVVFLRVKCYTVVS